jgi:hypothetical protein
MSDIFDDIDDDSLIEFGENSKDVKVATPVSIHGDNRGNITIEIHIPPRGTRKRFEEESVAGICDHENQILTEGIADMVKKILDHRFADGTEGQITTKLATPMMATPMAKNDIKALLKKGLMMAKEGDKTYDA